MKVFVRYRTGVQLQSTVLREMLDITTDTLYLLEKEPVRDVLAEKEGGDQVMDWTSFSTVGSEGKGVEPS